jgi:hypothetical protein
MKHEAAAEALGGKREHKGKLHVHHMEIHKGAKKSGHVVIHHMRHEDGSMPENPEEAQEQYPVQPGGLQDHIAQSGIDQQPDDEQGEAQQQQQQPAAGA